MLLFVAELNRLYEQIECTRVNYVMKGYMPIRHPFQLRLQVTI